MREHKRNVSKKEINKTLGAGKFRRLGSINQGRYKQHPRAFTGEVNPTISGELKANSVSGAKVSARKSAKSRYLPRTEGNLKPNEKISRPQNRSKPPRVRKRK